MTEPENDVQMFERWERSVEFRLFGDASDPTLTVPEQIATKVGDRVIAGQLQPGERIGEQELADEFKVSRGPVREAIRILEREGLVRVLARRGAVVTQLSARELHDLFEIRAGLFEIVVRKIAAQRPKDLLAVMREGVRRLGALADLADGGNAYAEMTYRLIVISARFSGNDRLRRMISALSLQTLRYSKLGLASVERRQRSVGLWQQSLLALEQGDTERLIALSHQRTQESGAEAVRLLQDDPPAA
ncbi:MAG: GntR family transcriptional regulator [Rhodoferax sp.]|nr:GntR family transcriptional regulator [Rhodoferax sp.]MBP9929109.1 GntR family transcriptional regulator [Rhodoferax sp.]HQX60727.1 GntR family transcriptional regulator [Burkholderiaceae bacterium]HQZ06147.1 GntR family transcriptional regulator [Burkholderiaceae bacterium]HRA61046.1 GntR family transcriptional regulator [Burkholderiaceae bacterium]